MAAGLATIPEQIQQGDALSLTYSKLNTQKVLAVGGDGLVINFLTRLNKYRYPLEQYVQVFNMSEEEYRKYRFRPKVFSYDMYGTVELSSLIMCLNGIVSVSEFNFKQIKYYDPAIKGALLEILNKERKTMMKETDEINEDLKHLGGGKY